MIKNLFWTVVFIFLSTTTNAQRQIIMSDKPRSEWTEAETAQKNFMYGLDKSFANFERMSIEAQLDALAMNWMNSIQFPIAKKENSYLKDYQDVFEKKMAQLKPEQIDQVYSMGYGSLLMMYPKNKFPKDLKVYGSELTSLNDALEKLWVKATQNNPTKMNQVLCKNLVMIALRIQTGENLRIEDHLDRITGDVERRLQANVTIPQQCNMEINGQNLTFGLTETANAYKMEKNRLLQLKRTASAKPATTTTSISYDSYCTKAEVTDRVGQTIDFINSDKRINEMGVFNMEKACRIMMYLRRQKNQWKFYDYGQGLPVQSIVGVDFNGRDELIGHIMKTQKVLPKLPKAGSTLPGTPGTVVQPQINR
jgi:hypothetical protein